MRRTGNKKKGWFESLGKWTRIGMYAGIVAVLAVQIPRVITMLGAYKYFGTQIIMGEIIGVGRTIIIFVPIAIGYLIDKFKKGAKR